MYDHPPPPPPPSEQTDGYLCAGEGREGEEEDEKEGGTAITEVQNAQCTLKFQNLSVDSHFPNFPARQDGTVSVERSRLNGGHFLI